MLIYTIVNVSCVLTCLILISGYIIYLIIKFVRMDPEDAKFLRTDRRPGTLDVHPILNAIVLNYELEVQILGQNESILYGEKQNLKKIIELPMLSTRSDCNALAKEVLSHCDLIHPSRHVELEQTIFYLKKRKVHTSGKDSEGGKNCAIDQEKANINNLTEYIELLYEGIPEKVKASMAILVLAREPDNLESLSKNETLLSALTRVLREDWKKSIVLCTNLIFIFFCFSTYSCFHNVILQYKIGSLCMNVIGYELQRYEDWKLQLESGVKEGGISNLKRSCSNSISMSEIPRSRIPEKVRPKSGNFSDVNMKSVMDGSVYDDLSQSIENIDDKKQLTEAEKAKRYRTLIKKQEQLLRVSFFLLLNIAEDENVEEKMAKKNIVDLLIRSLDRENEELLILVLTFLKKLSIMQVNKDDMIECQIIDKVHRMLQSNNVDVLHLTLKLLFNLSFEEDARIQMVPLLPKFVTLLSDDRHQDVVIKLLYHLSYDEEVKAQFSFTDCVSLIVDMLLLSADIQVDEVMVALCINLATNSNNAQQMIDDSRLHGLMTRAVANEDCFLMKMLHNISEHNTTRSSYIEFVGDLAKAATESKKESFVLECIGVLSNLHLSDLDWAEIFKHFNMMSWVKDILISNSAEPDIILNVIILLGTAAHDEGCSVLFCKSEMISCLIDLLKTYQEDDEIVLQIMYVFMIALSHQQSIDYVISDSEAPAYLIDLLQDNNKAIRKTCNICLDMISERSSVWGERIKIERFRNHNAQWLQMVDSHQLEPDLEEEDSELPPYLNTDFLSVSVMPPLKGGPDVTVQESEIISNKELDYNYFERADNNGLQDFEMESM
ncbi:PREDICTED: kinesin-associated protein 3 [Nicrophorus vespilloides]|uniref:Kinesin-associated protein 3 n=1 Tax=Nicrophorus vespilloides TaxID=110193 RepID=A0ABM1MDQ8_NICVS|nr:PREDICTED: kinesin-associated protein 3 [Nicrophorus vespilloides]